jgi:hypothetical protein
MDKFAELIAADDKTISRLMDDLGLKESPSRRGA